MQGLGNGSPEKKKIENFVVKKVNIEAEKKILKKKKRVWKDKG